MMTSVGDLAQSILMKQRVATTKATIQTRADEVATGRVADTPAHLRGDLAELAGIDTTLARLDGYRSVAADAALFAQAQQAALAQVSTLADDAAGRLLATAQGTPLGIDAAARAVGQDFRSAISALNLRFGDRALFAGDRTDSPAFAGADAVIAAATGAIAGAASADEVVTRLRAWMDDPAGFRAMAYRGGDPAPPVAIAPDETAALDVTATDPALRSSLTGLLLGAMLAQGTLAAAPAARADLARRAGEMLAATATDRAHLTARLGQTEGRIAGAQARNGAEATALGIARAGLVQADPFAAATALEEARARLETLYTLTARLSRLSLTDYL